MTSADLLKRVMVILFVGLGCSLSAIDGEASAMATGAKPSRVLIVSAEARKNVAPETIRQFAEEDDAVLVSPAKLPAYSKYVNCDPTGPAAVLGWLAWACDTEYFCAGTMSLVIKIGAQDVTCEYTDCKLQGDKCDCDLKPNQHSACPK